MICKTTLMTIAAIVENVSKLKKTIKEKTTNKNE
jgi:hypothetical protein